MRHRRETKKRRSRAQPGIPEDATRSRPAKHHPETWRRVAVVLAATTLLLGLLAALYVIPHRGRDLTPASDDDAPALPANLATAIELPRVDDTEGLDPRLRESLEVARSRAERERSAPTIGELGRLYNAHHYLEPARRCYEMASALDSSDPEWPYHLARLAAERGELEDAVTLLRRVLDLRPDYLAASTRLGDLLLAANRHEDARAVFAAITSRNTDGPWGELGLGKVELRRGVPGRALEHLERAHRFAPAHAEVRYLLATTYRDLGRADRAAELLRGLERGTLPERPPDPLLHRVLEKRQDLQVSIATANALLAAGRITEAEALYRSVLAYDPHHYDALYDLGVLYGRSGRYEEARVSLEAAVEARPTSADARLALAMAQAALGQHEAARREAELALELAPDDERPRLAIAMREPQREL
jgi:tetratricopeptide (TPR) repeat protein